MKLLKKAMSLTLALLLLVSMLPVSVAAAEGSTPVCAQMDGCGETAHNTGCPCYVAPPAPCTVSGCTKTADHEGECTVNCTVTTGCNKKNKHTGDCFVPCSVNGCEKAAEHEGECTVNCTVTTGCSKKNKHTGDCFIPCSVNGCEKAAEHEGECTVNCTVTTGCNKKNKHTGDCFVPCSVNGCEKAAEHEGECTVNCTVTTGCTKKNKHTGDCAVPCNHTYSAWDWFADEENDGEDSTFLRTCSTCLEDERDASPELIEQIMDSEDPEDVRAGVAAALEAGAITQDAADAILATLNTATNEIQDTDVAKIGESGYATLQAAFDVGGTVTLLKNVTLTDGLEIASGKSVVLNLAGFTITYASSETTGNAAITNKGSLTVNGSGKITYSSSAPSSNNAYGTSTISNEGGTLTISGATIENTTSTGASYAIDNNSTLGATALTVQSGAVSAVKTAIRAFANSTSAVNSITISGGSVTGSYAAIWMHLPGTDASAAPLVDLNVNGGTLSGGENYAFYTYSFGNAYSGVDIDISSGTFTGWVYLYKNESMDISGGTFNGGITVRDSTNEKVSISGGTFAEEPNAAFIAIGYKSTESDGKYVVIGEEIKAAVGSGSEQTYTIAEAVAAAGNAATATQSVPITVTDSKTSESNSVPSSLIAAVAASTSNIDIAIPVQVPVSSTKTAEATVTFNKAAVEQIANAGSDVTLKVENVTDSTTLPDTIPDDAVVYDITLKKENGDSIFTTATSGVTATVTLPNPTGKANVLVCHYADNGTRTPIATKVSETFATFGTGHFSTYVIEAAGASVNDTTYDTFADALTAAPSGATIKLLEKVTLAANLTINKSITLDLNGFTIDGTGHIDVAGTDTKVTIKNGTITAKSTTPNTGLRVTGSACELNLDGVKLSGADYGLRIEEAASGCTVNVNSGTEISAAFCGIILRKDNTLNVNQGAKVSGKNYGISGNGNANQGGTTINILGGTVEATDSADSVGIFQPQIGQLNISGGTVQGRTGVEIRSGTLNVTGGTIKGTGELTVSATGDGPTTYGAAIAVAQHTTKHEIDVNISGGSIQASDDGAAVSVDNPQDNNVTNVDVDITGGSFTGPLSVEKDAYGTGSEKIVSGGSFDQAVDADLTANNFAPIQNANGTYGVGKLPEGSGSLENATFTCNLNIIWDDEDDDYRPEEVVVRVYADKKLTYDVPMDDTFALASDKSIWSAKLTLPSYTDDDPPKVIEYTVELDDITHYTTTYEYTANTINITNTAAIAYIVTKGADQNAVTGSDVSFTINADADKLEYVQVDGKTIDDDNYTVKSGSTILTLKADYAKKLTLEKHTLTVVYSDGAASTTFTMKAPTYYVYNPDKLLQTGQMNAPMFLMGILGTAALTAGFWFLMVQRKERHEN